MSAAPFWIQSSDFSQRDFPASTAHIIEQALESHDWKGEFDQKKQRIANNQNECPAGLGVVADDGRQLIIRPDENEQCEVEYSFYVFSKMLGFISRRKYFAGTLRNTPFNVAKSLIAPFLENDYDAIKMEIESRL